MTTLPLAFRDAVPGDLPAVRGLLDASGLPTEDVSYGAQILLAAWDGPELAGVVGLEGQGRDALLRSLAVAESWRGRGLGGELTERAMERARALGIQDLYLLTSTAEAFFAKRGFARVPREAVPPAVRGSRQFAGLCAATTPCLARRIG